MAFFFTLSDTKAFNHIYTAGASNALTWHILNRFYNVTSPVHSYIVIRAYCFSRPSFRATVSALWCLL